jgi:hypothetical protein
MAAPPGRGGADGYCDLPDVRLELDPGKVRGGGGGFTVCFWLYLSSSARPSSVILHQVGFLSLSLSLSLYFTSPDDFNKVWKPISGFLVDFRDRFLFFFFHFAWVGVLLIGFFVCAGSGRRWRQGAISCIG